jgi:hypothetical protein
MDTRSQMDMRSQMGTSGQKDMRSQMDTSGQKDTRVEVRTVSRKRRHVGRWLVAAGVAYVALVRPWHLRWGATDEEVAAAMPGDDIAERPQLRATRAVDIAAPPEAIWPWLVQMGAYTRAGWYSYDHIDNAGVPSAEHIVPELQHLAVGDVLPTSHDGRGFTVERIEPQRYLVLAIRQIDSVLSLTYALRPVGPDHTRLLARLRLHAEPTAPGLAFLAVMDFGDFVMQRRTLRGIRRRAEALHRGAA